MAVELVLRKHRAKEDLGGLVYLLGIDMSAVTGDPSHILYLVNTYGERGQGVTYQGKKYLPHPYNIDQVKKSHKANKTGAKLQISDNDDLKVTRFIDKVGGNLQNARIYELKVYGRFLDTGTDPNILAYTKRLDHLVSYVEDSDKKGELIIHTIDPLSKDVKVPAISFSAGVPNGTESAINIFPAVERSINRNR